jgi:hypothetical protein
MSAGTEHLDLQPDDEDVLQSEPPYHPSNDPPVCVTVDGPVRTQALPTKAGATLTKALTLTPQKVLQADHRRAKVTLVCVGAATENLLVALSQAAAQDASRMALWPVNVPLVISSDSEVWAAAAAVTGTPKLGVITELWATGDGQG